MPESAPPSLPPKKKKKHNWMAGFVLEKKLTDADHVSMERAQRTKDYYHRTTKGRR